MDYYQVIQLDLTMFSIFSPPASTLDHLRQMPKVILVFARGIMSFIVFLHEDAHITLYKGIRLIFFPPLSQAVSRAEVKASPKPTPRPVPRKPVSALDL